MCVSFERNTCSLAHSAWFKCPSASLTEMRQCDTTANEIEELWLEYDGASSKEAKLVKDFDKVKSLQRRGTSLCLSNLRHAFACLMHVIR
jgi:5'-deoxynucleotidase YfbR-like HD superfamily hydrolase